MSRLNKFVCSICNALLTDKCSCIECSECKVWTHTKCLSLNKTTEKEYSSNYRLKFFCRVCISADNTGRYDFNKALLRLKNV